MTVERVSSHSPFSYFYESIRNEKASSMIESQKQNHASTSEIPQQGISKEKLEEVVKGLNEFLQPSHTSIKFELHDELQEYYVQIIDERTNEVIREIPPKKLLDMYAAMMEFVGLIVDKKI
ncbi:flagellar protein FlaG [Saccharococcus caldoxylosilyticus]|uniref:flagellar protein FlaG n=1 Tax=Saccharococcus caldoxylosilyticus TaxID=81408 RepID=UPI0002F08597|nr:flagellar protein FlaG [Parageobacillus caldoxylosilyticus]